MSVAPEPGTRSIPGNALPVAGYDNCAFVDTPLPRSIVKFLYWEFEYQIEQRLRKC